jgi:excisionase family DNA binding protein
LDPVVNPFDAREDLVQLAGDVREIRTCLEKLEARTVASVAAQLAQAAVGLERTARDLHDTLGCQWMTSAEAARHLGYKTTEGFNALVNRQELPRHCVSGRTYRYNRAELDEWLLGR